MGRTHTHRCERKGCTGLVECSAGLIDNYDGWPEKLCGLEAAAADRAQAILCEECEEGAAFCDGEDAECTDYGDCRGCLVRRLDGAESDEKRRWWQRAIDEHDARDAEANYEDFLSRFYGGSAPVTDVERCDAALKERQELERRR